MNALVSVKGSGPGIPFWGSWSIRTRLMLLVLLSVLPALAIIFHTGLSQQQNDIDNARKNVLLTVENLAKYQDTVTLGIKQMLMTIAQYPSVQQGDVTASNQLFSRLHQHAPGNCQFIFARPDGMAYAEGAEGPFSIADRGYFQQVVTSRRFVAGEYVVSRANSAPVLPYAFPVINDAERFSGVIVATVDLMQYQDLLQRMGFPEGSVVGIEDRNGLRLCRFPILTGMINEGLGQPLPEKIRRHISGSQEGTYTEEGVDGIRRIYGYIQLRLPDDGEFYLSIRVGIPERSAFGAAVRRLKTNLILFGAACTMALAAAWFLGNLTLVDPITHLARVSQQLGIGNLKARSRLSHTKGGEIGLLARSLDIMAANQEQRENERLDSLRAIGDLSRRNKLILDAAGEGIVGLDSQGLVIFINPAAAAMTGYAADELLGQDLHLKIHHSLPDGSHYPLSACPMHRTLRQGVACRIRDEVLWRKDGTNFPCAYSSTSIVNDGKIAGVVIIFRDISERVRAENLLRRSEEHFRLLIENISDVIIVLDIRGTVRYASPSLERVFGYQIRDLTDKSGCDLVHPDDLFHVIDEFGRSLVMPGFCFTVEMRCRHKEGTWRFVETVGKSFYDRKGRLSLVLNSHDITEKKRAEEEREKIEAQFRQAQKMESVGRLAGGVAHDFNNMLSVIIGHADMALSRLLPVDPIHHNIEEILNASLRSADLTRQLLAFARKQTIAPKIVDLNHNVAEILKMLQRLIGSRIDIAWLPGEGLWPVKIDPTQLDQILVNLTVNARDAIHGKGSITIATANVVVGENVRQISANLSPGAFVLLTVTDTGEGMSEETLRHIFEPFFTTKEQGKGTGLGLSTVYGAVKQNNGLIEVESAPGRGTTFKIYLPRTYSLAGAEPNQEKQVLISRGTELNSVPG